MKIVVINNYKEEQKAKQTLYNLERCSGQQLEMLDYKTQHLRDIVKRKSPDLVILTGSNYMLAKTDTKLVFRDEMEMVKELDVPLLGICFGHQLIGAAYGSEIHDLGQTVRAFREVKLLDHDPMFEGLPEVIRVSESHRQALAKVPREFRLLAESATSRVEAMVHETRPIYSVQFHPERADGKNPHGQIILQNVIRLVANS